MKIVTVVGARPQFVKAAAVSWTLRERYQEVLVHTGQHYDNNMSEIFFEELHIPRPDYNLGVGSGSHARQTADMLVEVERILIKEKPDAVMVYGDTNSTLAGALAASKISVPIIHVEAGLRSFNKRMPEEQNRVLTDHLSDILFCPTDAAVNNLLLERIQTHVYQVGDVMCDAVMYYAQEMKTHNSDFYWKRLRGLYEEIKIPEKWYLATVHRAENTDTIDKIGEILAAFEEFDSPVVFPVHPRTRPMVEKLHEKELYKNIIFVQPTGYLDMLFLAQNAVKVVTDSGGLQKEAYILGTDTVTIRDQTEWIETLAGNYNILCKPEREDICDKVFCTEVQKEARKPLYGDGNASAKIIDIIGKVLKEL